MGDLVDLAEYRKNKEEEEAMRELEELEVLKKKVGVILAEMKADEAYLYLPITAPYDFDYSIPDSYNASSEWWGTPEEFSYYTEYGEED